MAALEQIPEAAIKAVAKRLKRYIDVERREEGFDSSGPGDPWGQYNYVGKGVGGTFHYNSLQDKHMQHFYRQPLMKEFLVGRGIAHPGMFASKQHSKRQRSKSAGSRSGQSLKRESAWLMENSSKILAEKVQQLQVYVPPTIKQSHSYGRSSSVLERVHSATSSNCSKSKKSEPLPSQRRHRSTSRSTRSDTESCATNSQRCASTRQAKKDSASDGRSQTLLDRCHTSSCDVVLERNDVLPDAPSTRQVDVRHQQGINPLHQGPTNLQDMADHNTSLSSPSLAIQTGIGVVNVRGRVAVMQESVSVSTVSSCDASTQTLTHAETQTDQSTLLKMAMRRWKKDKRRTKECGLGSCTSTGSGIASRAHNSTPSSVMSARSESSVKGGSVDNGLGGLSAHAHTNNMEIWDGNISTAVTATRESKVHTYTHQLVASGDVTKLREILAKNPTLVNSVDEQGHAPLHIARITGKRSVIQVLASHGANLLTETPTGYTAMHCAAMYGNLECLKELLSMKCEINCRTIDKQTPLHVAAMSGQIECCQWLVAEGANVTAEDSNGRTPYDIARENDHQDIAQYMSNIDHSQKTTSVPAEVDDNDCHQQQLGDEGGDMLNECSASIASHDNETHTVSSEQSTPNHVHGDSQSGTDLMSSPSDRLPLDAQWSNSTPRHDRDNNDPSLSTNDIDEGDIPSSTTDHEPGLSKGTSTPVPDEDTNSPGQENDESFWEDSKS